MSSIAVLTLKEAIIPLVSTFQTGSVRTVKVEHSWTALGNNRTAKMFLPVCDDPSQKELFVYVVDQFCDATDVNRLNLTDASIKYSKFRIVLGGALRITWQNLSEARGGIYTDATFTADLNSLIATYMAPSSREDQLEYLRTATKPYNMSCEELGARLMVISRLGRFLPGSYDTTNNVWNPLINTDVGYKRAFFTLMPGAWKIKFAENGTVLDAATYPYQELVRFMAIQELVSKNRGAATGKRKAEDGGHRRNNFGRGNGGRFYNRSGRGGRGGRGYGGNSYGGHAGFRSGSGGRGRGYSNYGYSGNYVYPSAYTGTPGAQWGWSNRNPVFHVPGTPQRAPTAPMAGGGRVVTYSGSGGRGSGASRGGSYSGGRGPRFVAPRPGAPPPPYVPNFMNDQYYQEDGAAEEHYYQEGQEQFFASEDQYYDDAVGEEQAEEHYYGDSNPGDYNEQENEEKEEPQDAHWLQDFGY